MIFLGATYFGIFKFNAICNVEEQKDLPTETTYAYDLLSFKDNSYGLNDNSFSRAINIANWTHFKNPENASYITISSNPNEIYFELENGKKTLCRGLSILSAAKSQANNLTVRVVQLVSDTSLFNKNYTHVVIEVWSPEYKKWIMVDPTFNGYWVSDNEPLSVLETRERLLSQKGIPSFVVTDEKTQINIQDSYDEVVSSFKTVLYIQELKKSPKITGIKKADLFLNQYFKKCWVHYSDETSKKIYYQKVLVIMALYVLPFILFSLIITLFAVSMNTRFRK